MMADVLHDLVLGLTAATTAVNLLYCLFGVTLGTLIGVLPGLGPVATIAIILPFTYNVPPVASLVMLAGVYYGAQYGGSTTAILVRIPGEPASLVTCLDGHEMARRGRAGAALAIAAISSFIAGTLATFVVVAFAPPLSVFALEFSSVDYFSLMVLGLIASIVLANGAIIKALGMILLGILLGLVGSDINSGLHRFTFGRTELADGIEFAVIAMGLFGIGDIAANINREKNREAGFGRLGSLMPTRQEFRRALAPMLRGTGIGSLLGVLPGSGALLSSFAAYAMEKKIAGPGAGFGQGAVEGVAGPEAANNAGSQTSFIPMLTLGIPSNAVMALLVGALMIQGITPGPRVMTEQPELFWAVIVSMWLGNLFLLVLNLPLIGIWVRLLTVPYRLLFPAIIVFCCIGVFGIDNSAADVLLLAVFGVAGYLLLKCDCEPAPLALGFILGPMMEEHLRRALLLSRGDFSVFVTEPLSAGMLVLAALLLLMMALPGLGRLRRLVPAD